MKDFTQLSDQSQFVISMSLILLSNTLHCTIGVALHHSVNVEIDSCWFIFWVFFSGFFLQPEHHNAIFCSIFMWIKNYLHMCMYLCLVLCVLFFCICTCQSGMCVHLCLCEGMSVCLYVCMSVWLCLYVCVTVCTCSVACDIDDRLYLTQQLLAAVITKNIYDETKDAVNGNKTCIWLSGVVDWLLSLQSRFSLLYLYGVYACYSC